MTVLELGFGVFFGLLLFRTFEMLIELPFAYAKYRAHKRKHREMLEFMREATDGLVKHLETHNHGKDVKNAKRSSKTTKKTSTRSKATAGNRKATVQKVKKGV